MGNIESNRKLKEIHIIFMNVRETLFCIENVIRMLQTVWIHKFNSFIVRRTCVVNINHKFPFFKLTQLEMLSIHISCLESQLHVHYNLNCSKLTA